MGSRLHQWTRKASSSCGRDGSEALREKGNINRVTWSWLNFDVGAVFIL